MRVGLIKSLTLHRSSEVRNLIASSLLLLAAAASSKGQCTTQTAPAMSGPNGFISAIAPLADGRFAVGGYWRTAGSSMTTHGLGVYDPAISTLSPTGGPGSAMDGTVKCLLAMNDGSVLVGGDFTVVANTPARRIARWTPATGQWLPVANGHANTVETIAPLQGGDIAIGSPLGVSKLHLATETWTPLTSSISGVVRSLLSLPNGDLLAGGTFYSINGVQTNGVARYSALFNTWSRIGPDVVLGNPNIVAMCALPNGDVLIGGASASSFQHPGYRLARYNPATGAWTPLGSEPDSLVDDLVLLPDGDVAVAGSFSSVGNIAASRLARYHPNTNTWSPMGPGLAVPSLRALAALPNGGVLAGGYSFDPSTNNADTLSHLAIYQPGICAADFNCSGTVDVQDIVEFLNAWLSAQPRADFNGLAGINVYDIFDFLAAWFSPC